MRGFFDFTGVENDVLGAAGTLGFAVFELGVCFVERTLLLGAVLSCQ